jgi:flagellar motor component MotA
MRRNELDGSARRQSMTKDEFEIAYHAFLDTALPLALKALREGILALGGEVDEEKAAQRDIFHYTLQLAVDCTANELIDKIITNIIAQETDYYTRQFKTIQKEAVLYIQQGFNPKLLHYVLNSYTSLPIKDEETKFGIKEE